MDGAPGAAANAELVAAAIKTARYLGYIKYILFPDKFIRNVNTHAFLENMACFA